MADHFTDQTLLYEDAHRALGVIIDDDGRTVYAYLKNMKENKFVSDVWLFNRDFTPIETEWRQHPRPEMPFRNSQEFAHEELPFRVPATENDVPIEWGASSDKPAARILFYGIAVALLIEGMLPGYSLSAKKDGPIAKVLS